MSPRKELGRIPFKIWVTAN